MRSELGVVIFTVLVAILAIVFGVFAFLNSKAVEGDTPGDSMEARIRDAKAANDKLEDEIATDRQTVRERLNRIDSVRQDMELLTQERAAYVEARRRREKLKASGEDFVAKSKELETIINDKKGASKKTITDEETEERRKMNERVDELTQLKTKAAGDTAKLTTDFEDRRKTHRRAMNYQQSQASDSKALLADLTQREPEHAHILERIDGKVVVSDPLHNVVSISIGTGAGVKNGYRFEVYSVRPGNKHFTKCYVEVVKAGPTQSECMVLSYPLEMPADPGADYVAAQPEEMYSPLLQSGKKGSSVNPMTSTRSIRTGQNVYDPVVEGDYIQNPFYASGRQLTFYIAGSKEMVGERQKSAIRYRWTEIKDTAERYGAKVVDAVDTNVNYVIAQKNPQDDPEYKKAVDLGIPIVYEWELFRFLENR